MPNWMPSLYPDGRARLIPRRTSFNASRRSAGSAARYSVTVDAGMRQIYHEGFCRGNCSVRMRGNAQIKETARRCAKRRLTGNDVDSSHVHTLQSMTDWSRGGLRIHAELDAFLVSRWQGPVDPPANFVQRVPAIRGERGKILSHGGCWHETNLP